MVFKQIGRLLLRVILFLVALILTVILAPLGILHFIFKHFWKRRFIGGLAVFGDLILAIAALIDRIANVLLQSLFNKTCIIEKGYRFGDKDDTISFVLGVNENKGTLTNFGIKLCALLSKFEKDHCKVTFNNKLIKYENVLYELLKDPE